MDNESDRVAEAIFMLGNPITLNGGDCFWCKQKHSHQFQPGGRLEIANGLCFQEFKNAIQNLFNGNRQLNKKEAIKMRYSKR